MAYNIDRPNLFLNTIGPPSDFIDNLTETPYKYLEENPFNATRKEKYTDEDTNKGCFIAVKPFPPQYKDELGFNVIQAARGTMLLNQLERNWSAEGGFELPLTNEWKKKLEKNPYLMYHSARQLRYVVKDNFIVGLRCKDDIPYWTKPELMMVKLLIDQANKYNVTNRINQSYDNGYDDTNKKNYDVIKSTKHYTQYDMNTPIGNNSTYQNDGYDMMNLEESETKYFTNKIISMIKHDTSFKKLKKFNKKLKGNTGFNIINKVLKLYMRQYHVGWYDLRQEKDSVLDYIKIKLEKHIK